MAGDDNNNLNWQTMDEHIDKKLAPVHEKLDGIITLLKSGFPGGDIDGHRRAHEQWLEERKIRKERISVVTTDIIKGVVWAILAFVAAAVWYYMKEFLK